MRICEETSMHEKEVGRVTFLAYEKCCQQLSTALQKSLLLVHRRLRYGMQSNNFPPWMTNDT